MWLMTYYLVLLSLFLEQYDHIDSGKQLYFCVILQECSQLFLLSLNNYLRMIKSTFILFYTYWKLDPDQLIYSFLTSNQFFHKKIKNRFEKYNFCLFQLFSVFGTYSKWILTWLVFQHFSDKIYCWRRILFFIT